MATINLGRVKPVFRGAYAGGTAYVVDDIVTSGNETFICIQASTGNATSNASYWTKLAAKATDGTDGTDIGTTITTQGDILYRDGSGLARLAAGTAGQALLTGGAGANPSWGSAGGLKQLKHVQVTTQQSLSASSFSNLTNMVLSITPSSASNKIYVIVGIQGNTEASNRGWKTAITRSISGGSSTDVFVEQEQKAVYAGQSEIQLRNHYHYLDSPSTTSACSYQVKVYQDGGGQVTYQNGNNQSYITLMEVSV